MVWQKRKLHGANPGTKRTIPAITILTYWNCKTGVTIFYTAQQLGE